MFWELLLAFVKDQLRFLILQGEPSFQYTYYQICCQFACKLYSVKVSNQIIQLPGSCCGQQEHLPHLFHKCGIF